MIEFKYSFTTASNSVLCPLERKDLSSDKYCLTALDLDSLNLLILSLLGSVTVNIPDSLR
jgi:hypothetical protein